MINKNTRPSLLDSHQMNNLMFDEAHHAQRVVIVGNYHADVRSQQPNPDVLAAGQKEYITVPQIERIEVPTIIKEIEIREIQVPVVQHEIKFVEIEKIVYVPEVKIVEIEKTVIVPQVQIVEIVKESLSLKPLLYTLGFCELINIVLHFIK